MYKGLTLIAVAPAHNEGQKIGRVVDRALPGIFDTVLVVDDASTDQTPSIAREKGAMVIELSCRGGVGAAIRAGLEYAISANYDVAVILAGNNKDDPDEANRLVDPIADGESDFVIGSRYLPGGRCGGDMPLYRRWATRLHPWLMSWFCGRKLTESTNGFRAIRLAVLRDPRIRLRQRWLDRYGLEVYLLWKVIKLGYRHREVPCTKIYPSRREGFTKMRPVVDWWNILRPIFLLGFGLRE